MDFAPAADRHLEDAGLLHERGRLPNADHVAGYAAECYIKVVAMRFLGATVTKSGKPAIARDPLGHIDQAWPLVSAALSGRSSSAFALLLGANPFAEWSTADRYQAGGHITDERVDRHLSAARALARMVADARAAGHLA